jgi:hypothetical protein
MAIWYLIGGIRLPFSQLRSVSAVTPSNRAASFCRNPRSRRRRLIRECNSPPEMRTTSGFGALMRTPMPGSKKATRSHGFIAATSWTRAGKVTWALARATWTLPVSSGWRR